MFVRQVPNYFFCTALILMISAVAYAQKDTVVMKQGDVLTGEVVSVYQEVLLFKTAYAASEISLKWNQVTTLRANGKLKVISNKNKVYVGNLRMDSSNKSLVKIVTADSTISLTQDQILEISKFDKPLRDRFKMDIDLGIIKTKANNSDEVTLDIALKYFARRWELDLDYSAYATTVDTISNNRAALNLTARYNFPDNWFLIAQANSFKSTEQQVDYRVTYLFGTGKYIVRLHKTKLYGYFGGTYNRERFTISPQPFKTAEAFTGLRLEVKPVENLNIRSEFVAFPSLSQAGRVRAFSKTDVMLDFAKHFRFGMGYVLNTDSKPPVNSSKSDYLFNLKLGWSL